MSEKTGEPAPITVPDLLPVFGPEGGRSRAEVLVITGLSGAGRTRAADALEDLGWYVVDNLPPQMIRPLAGMMTRAEGGVQRLAVVVDIRSRHFFHTLIEALRELRDEGIDSRIIFLDASDATLVRRYEQVRRPHPLQGGGTILEGITAERELLRELRGLSDEVIDTSELSVYGLVRAINHLVVGEQDDDVSLTLLSFGFKYGLPLDADHVVDVRFLANPYWVPDLRELTGKDAPVRDYVLGLSGARDFVEHYVETIEPTLAGYANEHKRYVTIAIGCTGGKHRSVAMTEALAGALRERGRRVRIRHRDVGKE